MKMHRDQILSALSRLGEVVDWDEPVELLLIGGAAGMVTGELAAERVTADCDVIDFVPIEAAAEVGRSSRQMADEMG
ncbi:MAG: hypothetical protein MI741_22855, partial [Rhodospirillales bacterium]|nr:hypothetical protein [Rhodospirillales bacterium]